MEARAARLAIGIAVVFGAGCSALLGLEDNLDYSPGPSTGDGGGGDVALDGGSDGGPATCADGGGVCLSPNTWSGPLLLYTGAEKPGCPNLAPPSFLGHALLDVPDADCGCACTSACPSAVDAVFYTDGNCTTPCGSATVTDSTCTSVSCTAASGVFAAFDAGVACTATSKLLPPPVEENVVACDAVGIPGDCPAGLSCYPNPAPPPFGPYCVSQTQIATCPAGFPYGLVTAYGNINDTRACACTCTPPPEGACGLTLADSVGCAGDASVASTTCTTLLGGGSADASLQILDASAAEAGPCTAGGGLTGSVSPQGPPNLFCCTK